MTNEVKIGMLESVVVPTVLRIWIRVVGAKCAREKDDGVCCEVSEKGFRGRKDRYG